MGDIGTALAALWMTMHINNAQAGDFTSGQAQIQPTPHKIEKSIQEAKVSKLKEKTPERKKFVPPTKDQWDKMSLEERKLVKKQISENKQAIPGKRKEAVMTEKQNGLAPKKASLQGLK